MTTSTKRPRKAAAAKAAERWTPTDDGPAQPADTPTIEHVDPRVLVIGANVRLTDTLDPKRDRAFIDSIRDRGVLVPIVVRRDEQGQLVVLMGKRRTLAAVTTERPTVPAYVVTDPGDVDRLIDQLSENDHREGVTARERVAAYEQLGAFGVSAAQIAKRTGRPRKEVDAALAAAADPLAKGALARYDFLDVFQAAAVAEFADDTDAVKELMVNFKQGRTGEHLIQRLRDDREEAARYRALRERLIAEHGGTLRVLDRPVAWEDKKTKRLEQLLDDASGQPVDPQTHTGCPGHAVQIVREWAYDDEVDEHGVIRDEPDDDGTDDGQEVVLGGTPAVTRRHVRAFQIEPVCVDFATHGHHYKHARTGDAAGDNAAKSAEAAAAAKEQERQERRDLIASNKAMDSATEVRRRWLREFLARQTPPKTWQPFLAEALAHGGTQLTEAIGTGHELLQTLLGLEVTTLHYGNVVSRDPLLAAVTAAKPARQQVLLLGMVLCGYEAQIHRQSWRSEGRADPWLCRYLCWLAAEGYELSYVEKRAAGLAKGPEKGAPGSKTAAKPKTGKGTA